MSAKFPGKEWLKRMLSINPDEPPVFTGMSPAMQRGAEAMVPRDLVNAYETGETDEAKVQRVRDARLSVTTEHALRVEFYKVCESNGVANLQKREVYWNYFERGARAGYALRTPQLEDVIKEKKAEQKKVEKLEAEVARLEALVYVPGLWCCPKCKFTLHQKILNAVHGTVHNNDVPGEKCPNCDTPLWRVTERDAGDEMVERCAELQIRLNNLQQAINDGDKLARIDNRTFTNHDKTATPFKVQSEGDKPMFIDTKEAEKIDHPRITLGLIESKIKHEYYFTAQEGVEGALLLESEASRGTSHPSLRLLTFCVLVMDGGATITGESVPASPENFLASKGREAARQRALAKAFELEGYRLACGRKTSG